MMKRRYEGAAGNVLIVVDAGDSDVAFRVQLNGDDPDGDVILIREQVADLLDDLKHDYFERG